MPTLARGNPARWWKSRSCGGVSRAPRSLFIGPIRRWAARIALTLLVLLLVGLWYVTNPKRISRLSEVLLSRVLGGNVKVQTGHLSLSGTLILQGIEVRTPESADATVESAVPIFTAEQIEARFDWLSLFSGQLNATQLVATTPVFGPIENRDTGHWNYELLRPGFGGSSSTPSSHKGLSLPVVVLRDARVKWGEIRQGKLQQTSETVIDGELTPDPHQDATYRFQFNQYASPISLPGAAVIIPTQPGVRVRGMWDTIANSFNISSEDVVMSDTLRNGLPAVARDWCQEHHLAGRLSKVNMEFNPQDGLTLTVDYADVGMIQMISPEQGMALGEAPAYPVDINNVRGRVVFSLKQNLVRVVDLRGKILGYDFIANCDWHGTSRDAPYDLSFQFPNANVSDHYPPLFLATNTSQDIIQRMEPHGHMDISVEVHRTVPRGPELFTGQIDLHDARMRYAHFPAPLDHVNGRITFDNQSVTFRDVTGKSDLIDARISGTCGTVWTNRFVDMTISSSNLLLDDRLAACLPDNYLDVWKLFTLQARGGFVCRVTRGTGLFDKQKISVDLDLTDARGYLHAVPYAFNHGTGKLHLDDDGARIEHFVAQTGIDGSGRITLDGVVRQSGDDVIRLQPEIRVLGDVPVDALFINAFPETLTAKLAGITLGGRVGFDGTIRRTGELGSESVQVAGNVSWNQGTLQTSVGGQPLHFSGINAQAALSPTAVDVKSLTALVDVGDQKLQLQIAGKVDLASYGGLMHVSVTGKDFVLPAGPPALLTGAWRETWNAFQPAGTVDLSGEGNLRINLPVNPAAAQPSVALNEILALDAYTVRLNLHDVSIKDSSWPAPLASIKGKVEIVPGTVSMIGMSGTMGNLTLAWNGQTEPSTGKMTLSGDASSKGLPTQWLNHLPDALSDLLDRKHPEVALNFHMDSLTRAATGKPWELQGKLHAANLAMIGAVPLVVESADLTGKGVYTPAAGASHPHLPWLAFLRADSGSLNFSGAFAATHLTVSDRRIDTLTARIVADADHHAINLTDIDGKVAGGVLQGYVHITTSGAVIAPGATSVPGTLPASTDGGFVAELVLNDAELARLALSDKASEEERKKIGTGRVTASLSLQQTFGPNADRTGRGDLVVRDGDIYNVPLSMGLMQVATLRLPVARAFQQASMSYFLRNDQITFERILLESQGINLAGLGTVSLSSREMDMSFITESPNEVNIPLLTPLFGGIRSGLLELSVTGPIDSPRITPVPLSAISNLLRALLPKSSADARHRP